MMRGAISVAPKPPRQAVVVQLKPFRGAERALGGLGEAAEGPVEQGGGARAAPGGLAVRAAAVPCWRHQGHGDGPLWPPPGGAGGAAAKGRGCLHVALPHGARGHWVLHVPREWREAFGAPRRAVPWPLRPVERRNFEAQAFGAAAVGRRELQVLRGGDATGVAG